MPNQGNLHPDLVPALVEAWKVAFGCFILDVSSTFTPPEAVSPVCERNISDVDKGVSTGVRGMLGMAKVIPASKSVQHEVDARHNTPRNT